MGSRQRAGGRESSLTTTQYVTQVNARMNVTGRQLGNDGGVD